jgi:hypothetical protein
VRPLHRRLRGINATAPQHRRSGCGVVTTYVPAPVTGVKTSYGSSSTVLGYHLGQLTLHSSCMLITICYSYEFPQFDASNCCMRMALVGTLIFLDARNCTLACNASRPDVPLRVWICSLACNASRPDVPIRHWIY